MNTTKGNNLPKKTILGCEIFEGANITDAGYFDILNALNGAGKYAGRKIENFGKYNVSECGSIFLVECSSHDDMTKIKSFWQGKFKKKTAFASELIDGREIPEYSGYFQHDGKYCILGALYYSANRRNLTPSDGSHNGILWYPSSGTKEVSKQTDKISERAGDVLKKPSVSD